MPLRAADYEFDVFFSYKRHTLSIDWTRRVSTLFKFYLSHELNVPEARVFVDEESIELGEPWPEALQRALRRCTFNLTGAVLNGVVFKPVKRCWQKARPLDGSRH